jgi:hypothetical protein
MAYRIIIDGHIGRNYFCICHGMFWFDCSNVCVFDDSEVGNVSTKSPKHDFRTVEILLLDSKLYSLIVYKTDKSSIIFSLKHVQR